MQHEVAVGLALQRLDLLLVGLGAERGGDQRLRLAAREERRAVGPRQVADLDGDRPDLVDLAAVDPQAALDDHAAAPRRSRPPRTPRAPRPSWSSSRPSALPHLVEHAADRLGARVLLVRRQRGGQLAAPPGSRTRAASARSSPAFGSNVQRGLPACADQLLLDARQPLALLVAEGDRLQHLVLGALPWRPPRPSARASSVPATTSSSCEASCCGRRRIGDELAVDQADADGADRTARTGCRRGRARRRRRSWPARRDRSPGSPEMTRQITWTSLRKPSGKSGRIGRSIRRRGQGLLLDRRALALEVAAGDPAAGVGTLAILDGQREEVLAPPWRSWRRRTVASTMRAAEADDDGAVGLLGDLAGLDGEGVAVDVDLNGVAHTNVCPRGSAVTRRTPV